MVGFSKGMTQEEFDAARKARAAEQRPADILFGTGEYIHDSVCVFHPDRSVLVTSFNDPLSIKEYLISGMCQSCQNGVFEPR